MTEAGWTREKPKEAGWYWWRDVDKHGKVRFCVCQEVYLLHGSLFAADCGYLDKLDGEWLGPITPDSYRQGRVEGLREASKKASDAVPLLFGTHPNFANYIADALMDFSDILNEDADKLAQAAQDEKGVGDVHG